MTIERVDVFAGRVVDDRIRVLPRDFYLGDRRERFQIEDGYRIAFAVTREAAIEVVCKGDAMYAGRAGDIAGGFTRIEIEYLDMGCARYEQSMLR